MTVEELRDRLNELITKGFGSSIVEVENYNGDFDTYSYRKARSVVKHGNAKAGAITIEIVE